MKRSRFSEEQIIGILKEQEAGAKTAEVCRKHGLHPLMLDRISSRHGGVADVKVALLREMRP